MIADNPRISSWKKGDSWETSSFVLGSNPSDHNGDADGVRGLIVFRTMSD